MKRAIFGAMFAAVAGLLLANLQAADEKPKMTIKEVMKLHKEKLNDKFSNGTATKEEKEKLLEGYEALVKNKPPKGDEKDWKTKTEALVKAVKDDDKDAYKKAVNCGACHGAHKGS
jgi:gas vesicle protein